jgi:heat shock protein HslJ
MRFFTVLFLTCILVSAFFSGCTSQQPVQPVITAGPAPAMPVSPTIFPASIPVNLAGNWTLMTMGIQGGTAVIEPSGEITLSFGPESNLNGYDGCNNYFAAVNLTGTMTSDGNGMQLGPVGSSKMYCAPVAGQEQQYLNILGKTSAYVVDGSELTLTARTGDVLIYHRPGSP